MGIFRKMDKMIENLQKLGLSGRESEIYLALLKRKEFTAFEIGKITSVSRNKSYEILQSLIKKGLCTEKYMNRVKVYRGIEPEIALENIISIYEDDLNEKKRLKENFKHRLTELYKSGGQKEDSLDYIEILTDLSHIRKRWLDLQSNAEFEILGFNKPPYAVTLEQNVSHQEAAAKRKINEKGIYEFNGDPSRGELKDFISVVEMYLNIGEEVRIINALPMKMMIIDEKITMLALKDPVSMKPSITTIIINHSDYARTQKKVFENFWADSITVDEFKKSAMKYPADN